MLTFFVSSVSFKQSMNIFRAVRLEWSSLESLDDNWYSMKDVFEGYHEKKAFSFWVNGLLFFVKMTHALLA